MQLVFKVRCCLLKYTQTQRARDRVWQREDGKKKGGIGKRGREREARVVKDKEGTEGMKGVDKERELRESGDSREENQGGMEEIRRHKRKREWGKRCQKTTED